MRQIEDIDFDILEMEQVCDEAMEYFNYKLNTLKLERREVVSKLFEQNMTTRCLCTYVGGTLQTNPICPIHRNKIVA